MSGDCEKCGEHCLDCKCCESLRLTFVSDLHGYLPDTPGGDILIIGGDLTASDKLSQYEAFIEWLEAQAYGHKIVIGGNHDMRLANDEVKIESDICKNIHYLEDSSIIIEGIKFYGFPWTVSFLGVNPLCKAFMVEHDLDLQPYLDKIPWDVDVLISHGPMWGILDDLSYGENCGSHSLRKRVEEIRPSFFLCAHIHEQHGRILRFKNPVKDTMCINGSYVDENYRPQDEIRTITWKK